MNNNNFRTINITGKNTNDIYTVNVPSNLLGFCRYDFTRFMEESNKLCRECMKSGEYPSDKVIALRNSISSCHKYVENNIRTVYDKIVIDCWIEYICREGETSASALWNSLIDCGNPFQKAIFQRLTEYRSHFAINQWITLLKLQEYAKKKLDFVFGCRLTGSEEAEGRLNFFDLMFSVAANEQGYSLENIGSVRTYKSGRLTNAPFVFGGVSKEIVRNLLSGVSFADDIGYTAKEEGVLSDREAMDAFGVIKNHLPEHADTVVRIMMKSMVKAPETVYMPSSFKAMIDLEIDSVIDSGGYLQKCARCKEFFYKDVNYTSDYCDTVNKEGSTCREIMEGPVAEPLTDEELALFNQKAEQLYNEMLGNMNRNISQRDFNEWIGYFEVIKNNVVNGRGTSADFDDFVEYSRQIVNQKPSKAKQEVMATEEEIRKADGTKATVKPYQFVHIDRRELERQGLLKPAEEEKEDSRSFNAEPPKAVAPPTPPVNRIIRGPQTVNSYQEIPVKVIGERENSVPRPDVIPKDVYIGEDFSLGANKPSGEISKSGSSDTAASHASAVSESAKIAAEAARAEILSIAETEKKTSEEEKKPVEAENKPAETDRKPVEDFSEANVEDIVNSESKPEEKHILPDFEDFPKTGFDNFDTEDLDLISDIDNAEEYAASENSVKHEAPKVRFPAPNKHPNGSGFLELLDEKEREETGSIVKVSEPSKESEARNAKSKSVNKENKDSASVRRRTEMNKAARVAGAYRNVADMDKKGEDGGGSSAEDFAKILSSIERNDGFDEDIPNDPDGVPLSHKTKHVMDAIMKNSGVSPSLTYGRRQAAEKNVIIDEEYVEKNGKGFSDKK